MADVSELVPEVRVRLGDLEITEPSHCVFTEALGAVSLLQLHVPDPAQQMGGVALDDVVELELGYFEEGDTVRWTGTVTEVRVARVSQVKVRGPELALHRTQVSAAWVNARPATVAADLLREISDTFTASAAGEAAHRHFVLPTVTLRDALDVELPRAWGLTDHITLSLDDQGWWWGPRLESPRALVSPYQLEEDVSVLEYSELHASHGVLVTPILPSLRVGVVQDVRTAAGEVRRHLLRRVEHRYTELLTRCEWERL